MLKVNADTPLTAPAGWINDPNGLSYYKGEWHCFAQHNPDGVSPCWQGKDVCWYHWVSSDLLHWTALGVAIHQDELGTCASGSAVTDVSQPCEELGRVALRTLVERILHRDLPPREILLGAELVLRDSTH